MAPDANAMAAPTPRNIAKPTVIEMIAVGSDEEARRFRES
jgi:hypothetical protein